MSFLAKLKNVPRNKDNSSASASLRTGVVVAQEPPPIFSSSSISDFIVSYSYKICFLSSLCDAGIMGLVPKLFLLCVICIIDSLTQV
jgi:hypothetical protein